jgi:hypothetical protein
MYLVKFIEWFPEIPDQPFFTCRSSREIEFMKNGEFFFGMEDGKIII